MAKGDPRKPKGKMSAYAYFVQTCHEEHKKKSPEVPVNFTEFSKKCSARWKMMTEKEKSKFEEMARRDKVRYDQEMMHYNPGKRGKKKDPYAPKRPPSGFFIFCSEHRPKIKAQYPSFGIGDVAKKLGEMWNSLPDATKQPYLQKANKLKDKYQKDVADYRSKGRMGGGMGSMAMGNGMAMATMTTGMHMGMGVSMGMDPKEGMKSHKDDDDDEDDEDDEEDEDDDDEDDE